MTEFLNPRNDAVFKMYFASVKNRELLKSILQAILNFPSQIDTLELLNPSLEKDFLTEKGAVLDLAVKLQDGTLIDVEMQVEGSDSFRKRILYYWAKLHASHLKVGESHHRLPRTVSIAILDYNEFKESKDEVHSIFELKERSRGTLFLPDMELHFLELGKYSAWHQVWAGKMGPQQKALDQWLQFFKIKDLSPSEVEEMQKEPLMSDAIKALESLSQDPKAKELADAREKARVNWALMNADAEARGRAEGEAFGISKGRAEGEARGIAIAQKSLIRKAHSGGMTVDQISKLFTIPISEIEEMLRDQE